MDVGSAMFRPGERIGPYVVHALIGVGFMGEVYRAAHVETGEAYALKCLQTRHLGNAQLVERARREARALSEIRHANIVYVHEAGVTDTGVVWMAMELLSGRSLRRVMKDFGRVPVAYALYFACEIADGVDAAHEHAIVHRDIKPENVFVTDENKVRVLDLGTAKFFGQDMETTGRLQVFGTVPYMSPEHLAGERVDGRTDVYALGMMLYEMLAGEHPFRAYFDNVLELGRAQLFQEPKPLSAAAPELPGFLWTLVEKAIAKDRERRYGSMSELAREIRRAKKRFEAERPASGAVFEQLQQTIPNAIRSVHGRGTPPPSDAPAARASQPSDPGRPLLSSGTVKMTGVETAQPAQQKGSKIGPYGTQVIPADVLKTIQAQIQANAAAKPAANSSVNAVGTAAHPVQQTGAGQVISTALPPAKKGSLKVFLVSFGAMLFLCSGIIIWWWKTRTSYSNTFVNATNTSVVAEPLPSPELPSNAAISSAASPSATEAEVAPAEPSATEVTPAGPSSASPAALASRPAQAKPLPPKPSAVATAKKTEPPSPKVAPIFDF